MMFYEIHHLLTAIVSERAIKVVKLQGMKN